MLRNSFRYLNLCIIRIIFTVYTLSLSLSVTVCLCLSARSDAVGVFVKHVVPGSAADQSGNIRIHDRLIAVRTCCLIRVVPAGLLFLSVPS